MNASPTLAERRERLALVCQLDRLHLRLALRPAPENPLTIAGVPVMGVTKALSLTQLFPGKIGRLSRGFAFGSALFRVVQPFIRGPRRTTH